MNEDIDFLNEVLKMHDNKWLSEKKKWIRTLDKERKYYLVKEVIKKNTKIGLDLAHSCINDKKEHIDLLEYGLLNKDISEIKHWIEKLASRLSLSDINDLLIRVRKQSENSYRNAVYWFPNIPINNINKESIIDLIRGIN